MFSLRELGVISLLLTDLMAAAEEGTASVVPPRSVAATRSVRHPRALLRLPKSSMGKLGRLAAGGLLGAISI